MKKLTLLCFFALSLIFSAVETYALDFENVAPHPRLMLRSGDITSMRALRSTSVGGRTAHEKIIARAESMIEQPVVAQLLDVTAREVLERMVYLSYSYLTTDDVRYARRAEQEMLSVSAMKDWNPSTIVDAATVTMALAIGYDWLYRALPVRSRSIIGTAIYEKGLRALESESLTSQHSLVHVGMFLGAVAIVERAPEFCKNIIASHIGVYDGLATEGCTHIMNLGQWEQEVTLLSMYATTLASSLGEKIPSSLMTDLAEVSQSLEYMVSPSLQQFNYGGSDSQAHSVAAKYWVAKNSQHPSLVAIDERLAAQGHFAEDFTLPLYMLFASGDDFTKAKLSTTKKWHDDQMAVYRAGWDKNDTYMAIKGGDATSAGEFVFERGGVRWVSLAGDIDGRLVIDGACGGSDGVAHVQEVYDASRRHGVIIDLSALYSPRVLSLKRNLELGKDDKLSVTDMLTCGAQPISVEWSIMTAAQAEIVDATTIKLTMSGQTLFMKVRSRVSAVAKIWPDAEGARRVGFVLTADARSEHNIEVTFTAENVKRGLSLARLNLGRK